MTFYHKLSLKNRASKYKNTPTRIDGYLFDSKLEAVYYTYLNTLKKQGIVYFFQRQCPFHLAPDLTYRVDFQVFYSDGRVEFVDVKGYETDNFINKKKMLESLYPISLTIIKSNDIKKLNIKYKMMLT